MNGALNHFEKIISIELSPELGKSASKLFENNKAVEILLGKSADRLAELRAVLGDASTLYWLDAHWCVNDHTAGEHSQCPLLDEINAIGVLNTKSVLLIDDARLFLAPPLAPHEVSQWPTFAQILCALENLSSEHEIMVLNDVIIVHPRTVKTALGEYAQTAGFDWLKAANALKEDWYGQLVEKEAFIQQQDAENSRLKNELESYSAQVKEQARALACYRIAYGDYSPLALIAKMMRRTKAFLWPRLGNLNQYAPRPLTVSAKSAHPPLDRYPKISIVTPSFGQGVFIERTLTSVLEQDYPNLEYVVKDGGSTDSTVEILEKHSARLTGWTSKKDGGQSNAINLGFAECTGEIMGWLNSDDLLLPHTLHTVAHYFERHPDVDVVYGNRLLIDVHDQEIGRWIMPGHDNRALSFADYIPQETLFWRRRIWDKAGGQIDESFQFAMDWDLLVRFRDAGANFAHIPQFLGAFRIHEAQKTLSWVADFGVKEMNRIRQRINGRQPTRAEFMRGVLPLLARHVIVDIAYRIKSRSGELMRSMTSRKKLKAE